MTRFKFFLVRNWAFFALLSCIFFAVALTGCNLAAWITSANQIIPIASSMVLGILSLIAALAGKTLSADVATRIAQVSTAVQNALNDISTMVAEYQHNPSTTLLGSIEAATTAVIDNVTQFLTDTGITDAATQSKVKAIFQLVLNEVQAFASLLPILNPSPAPGTQLTITVPMSSKQAKEAYNAILATPTGSPDVDAALAHLARL